MKKSFLLFAVAAIVAGCAKNDVVIETNQPEVQIGFKDAYIGKKTKAGEVTSIATLQTNNGTMKVWGWKTNEFGTSQVFNNQQVTYNANSSQETTDWEYTPIKYWDMEATNYKFYAVSPFTTKFSIDGTSRLISGTGLEQVQILEDLNGTSKITSANTTAIDYLVADVVDKAPKGNANDDDVSFTFAHILSKLNIKVKTETAFANTGSTYPQITISDLSIKLSGMCPDFTQKTAGDLTPAATDGDTWSGTAMSETSYVCFNADGTTVTDKTLTATAEQIASYLVTPTATGATPATHTFKVTVEYDIHYSATETEHFKATDKSITSLTSLVQNTINSIIITINPQAIYFDVESVENRTENATAGTVEIK